MTQVYKYLNEKYDVDTTHLFSVDQRDFHDTRGHQLKLVKSRSRLNIRKNFSQRDASIHGIICQKK